MTEPRESEEQQEVAGDVEEVLLEWTLNRLDEVLEKSFRIPKEKIQTVFGDDRVRVDEERPQEQQSRQLLKGNKVDIVKGDKNNSSNSNPENIDVLRIKIIEILDHPEKGKEDSDDKALVDDEKGKLKIIVKHTPLKNLTIENYKTPWKGSYSSDFINI
ncbi:unnamed protein product [Orchesella dallaii]|uniref:Uncharacterized protein n=1 Tax=Orchesella dallaii TaxID=48710 RepID=A0ABP1RVJ3_9HEXA